MLNTGVSLQRVAVKGKSVPVWTPTKLFSNSEYGAWWTAQEFDKNIGTPNLIDKNQDFGNFFAALSTITTGQSDPDGASNAVLLKHSTGTGLHYILNQAQSANWRQWAGYLTFSGYFKAKELNQCVVWLTANATSEQKLLYIQDLDGTPTINTAPADSGHDYYESASITSVGNGWYKLVATYKHQGQSSNVIILTTEGTGSAQTYSYTASNSTDGLYLYGFQLEHGQTATTLQLSTDTVIDQRKIVASNYKTSDGYSLFDYGGLVSFWDSKSGNKTLTAGGGNTPRIAKYPSRGKVNVLSVNRGSQGWILTNATKHGLPLTDELGGLDAFKVTLEQSQQTYIRREETITIPPNATYTASVYLKNVPNSTAKLVLGSVNPYTGGWFESSEVSVSATGSTWQRFDVSHTFANSQTSLEFRLYADSPSSDIEFEVSHPQIEKNSSATTVQLVDGAYEAIENGVGINQIVYDGTGGFDVPLNLNTNSIDEILLGFGLFPTHNSTTAKIICEHGSYADYGSGHFSIKKHQSSQVQTRVSYTNTLIGGSTTASNSFTTRNPHALTLHGNTDTGVTKTKIGSTESVNTVSGSTGVFSDLDFNVGCRNATTPALGFEGHMMEIVFRGGATTDKEKNALHDYINGKI